MLLHVVIDCLFSMPSILSCDYATIYSLSILDRHLNSFQCLAIVNSAAMNILEYLFL